MKAKKLTVLSLFLAAALLLSFVEAAVGFDFVIPGIKLGLANSVALIFVVFSKYRAAWSVNLVRVALTCLIFGNFTSFAFSLAGAVLSLAVMCVAHKFLRFSPFGVSFLGGVFHNIGQVLAAFIVFGSAAVFGYLPYLVIAGAVCGALTGFVVMLLTKNKNIREVFKKEI